MNGAGISAGALLAIMAGGAGGGGVFLFAVALRGSTSRPAAGPSRVTAWLRELVGVRGAVALAAGVTVLAATRWLAAGAGAALLVLGWRGLSGAAGERHAIARLEALATWTESLRDTIAGAVGLEQAIPASLRVASPLLRQPLGTLVDRLHTRTPMAGALRGLAADLNDPGADLIIAALIINSQLRGPGLRDLLGALSASLREELDVRRKVNAERRSTRRSAQIVVAVSVGLIFGLAFFDRSYVGVYGTVAGQLVLIVVLAVYSAGFLWMRRLATFKAPQRLLAGPPASPGEVPGPAGGRGRGA